MSTGKINTTPHAQELWEGIGGHFDSLTQVLAEFIDNAIANFDGESPELKQVAVRLAESADGIKVQVEDTGTGIRSIEVALRLGDRSEQQSPLSEHGFGIKHALATADQANLTWSISTRTTEEAASGTFRRVQAPFAFEMNIETPNLAESSTPWPGRFGGSGTVVDFDCSRSLFDAITRGSKGAPGFARTVEYLVEDLGYIYADIIERGGALLSVHDGTKSFAVSAVVPDWEGYYDPGKGSRQLDLGGGAVTVAYEFGEVNDSNFIRRYKRNLSTSGVEVRVNGRLIADGLFSEIWAIERHNSYNHFTARVNIITSDPKARPKTRSSKNGFHEGDPLLQALFDWIRKTITPDQRMTRHVGEKFLTKSLADRFEQLIAAPDKQVSVEKSVFTAHSSSPAADLYVFDGTTVRVYEAKRDNANVQDLYQLVMYWDGLVADGIDPTIGVLLSSTVSDGVADVIERFGRTRDANGNSYALEVKTWHEVGIDYPPRTSGS